MILRDICSECGLTDGAHGLKCRNDLLQIDLCPIPNSVVRRKKDGTLDMRYITNKDIENIKDMIGATPVLRGRKNEKKI